MECGSTAPYFVVWNTTFFGHRRIPEIHHLQWRATRKWTSEIYFKVDYPRFLKFSRAILQFDAPVWGAISDHAKDLLQQLLCVDQNDRLSVHEALEHRWLKVNFESLISLPLWAWPMQNMPSLLDLYSESRQVRLQRPPTSHRRRDAHIQRS